MPLWLERPSLNEQQRTRSATAKHQMEPREVTRAKAKQSKEQQGKEFRDQVWARDKHRCRATGVPLVRQGTIDPTQLGEVDHAYQRSTHPDRIYDVSNGILIQKALNRLRKRVCAEAPEFKLFDYEGPEDRGNHQTFIWRDKTGRVIRRTRG